MSEVGIRPNYARDALCVIFFVRWNPSAMIRLSRADTSGDHMPMENCPRSEPLFYLMGPIPSLFSI